MKCLEERKKTFRFENNRKSLSYGICSPFVGPAKLFLSCSAVNRNQLSSAMLIERVDCSGQVPTVICHSVQNKKLPNKAQYTGQFLEDVAPALALLIR